MRITSSALTSCCRSGPSKLTSLVHGHRVDWGSVKTPGGLWDYGPDETSTWKLALLSRWANGWRGIRQDPWWTRGSSTVSGNPPGGIILKIISECQIITIEITKHQHWFLLKVYSYYCQFQYWLSTQQLIRVAVVYQNVLSHLCTNCGVWIVWMWMNTNNDVFRRIYCVHINCIWYIVNKDPLNQIKNQNLYVIHPPS